MTKEVKITICGLQDGPETDGEPITFATEGEYFYKNNKHYILYEEAVEGESVVGKNRIKISGNVLELQKSGLVSTHMRFEEGQKTLSDYVTPYGTLQMGIDSKKVQIAESEDEIDLDVDYALEMNEEHAADCNIKITIKSKQ